MDKREKAKVITKIVFKSLWILISLGLWIFGIAIFINAINSGEYFVGWFGWCMLCTPAVLGSILATMVRGTRIGWRDGANTYSATVDSTSVTVQNHPLRGALIGLVGGLIGGVLVGPITLAIKTIGNIRDLVDWIRYLKG